MHFASNGLDFLPPLLLNPLFPPKNKVSCLTSDPFVMSLQNEEKEERKQRGKVGRTEGETRPVDKSAWHSRDTSRERDSWHSCRTSTHSQLQTHTCTYKEWQVGFHNDQSRHWTGRSGPTGKLSPLLALLLLLLLFCPSLLCIYSANSLTVMLSSSPSFLLNRPWRRFAPGCIES